jgi:hypothetical protein
MSRGETSESGSNTSGNGKGDLQRPMSVAYGVYAKNWDRVFAGKPKRVKYGYKRKIRASRVLQC